MKRKEFWEKYQEDPVRTWETLADKAPGARAKELYSSLARIEEERILSQQSIQTKGPEDTEIGNVQELLDLTTKGPTRREKISWWFSNILHTTRYLFVKYAALLVLLLGAITLGSVLGILAKVVILIPLAVCFFILFLATRSELNERRGPNFSKELRTVALLCVSGWIFLAAMTTFRTTLVSHEDKSLQAVYVVRDGVVIGQAIIENQNTFDLIHARVPSKDHVERFDPEIQTVDTRMESMNPANSSEFHIYTDHVNFSLEPKDLEQPFVLKDKSIQAAAEKVSAEARKVLLELSKNSQALASDLEIKQALSSINSPLFTINLEKVDRDPPGLEVQVGGERYKVVKVGR